MLKSVRSRTRGTVPIVLNPTSNLFAAGHRIRLHNSSSNYPPFELNLNSGRPLGDPAPVIVPHNAVHHDIDRAAHIVLLVIPS